MQGMLLSKILAMSLTGSYCILVVLLIRLLLKKCDRKYAYYLWFVAFLNLCLPFTLRGAFSLIPQPVAEFSVAATGNTVVTENTLIAEKPENTANAATGIFMQGNGQANAVAPNRQQDATVQKMSPMAVAQVVWLMGILLILLWNLISVRKLQRRIMAGNAVSLDERGRIAEVDSIDTPFLWGIFKPVIYLPAGMEEQEKSYIVVHESYHKHRKDYLAKIFVFAVVMLHWFNPLVWVAYALFCRDMEISCDEAVLSGTGENIKKQYAESLLKYAAKQNGYVITPLTFGEPSVKTRIKNVLRFQKKGVLLSGIAFILVLGVALGLIFRPKADVTVPVEEKDLLEIMQNASGYRTENYIYVDMDHDGREELIGIFEIASYDYEIWYCSGDGETCLKIPMKPDLEYCNLAVLPFEKETHVVINEYNMIGNAKQCTILKLEDAKLDFLLSSHTGYISLDEEGNILLTVEAYDGLYDPDLEDTIMHTWKATYLFYDGIAYKQYAAAAISEEKFLQFENADTLQSAILEECNLEDTEKLELTYFKRSNGILHVQCARHDSDGFIRYFYYTVKYEGKTLIPDLSDCRDGQMAETFTNLDAFWGEEIEKDYWFNKYIVSEVVNPEESGWDLTEIKDVRTDFWRMPYTPEPGTEDMTYLLAEEENYTLYGKGDYKSMLLACDEQYAEIICHYASNYMIPIEIKEADYDEDGVTELAIRFNVMHGTGVSVDTFFMADRTKDGALTVYQFLEDNYLEQLRGHISYVKTGQGIQAYIDGVEAGRAVSYGEDALASARVNVGEQIRFDLGEQITISADLGFYCDLWPVTDYNDCAISATLDYRDGGVFELTDFRKEMLDR